MLIFYQKIYKPLKQDLFDTHHSLDSLFDLFLADFIMLFFFISCFFSFFTIPAVAENAKLKHALAIPTGAPITVANEAIKTPPLVADKTINALPNQNSQRRQYIY